MTIVLHLNYHFYWIWWEVSYDWLRKQHKKRFLKLNEFVKALIKLTGWDSLPNEMKRCILRKFSLNLISANGLFTLLSRFVMVFRSVHYCCVHICSHCTNRFPFFRATGILSLHYLEDTTDIFNLFLLVQICSYIKYQSNIRCEISLEKDALICHKGPLGMVSFCKGLPSP